ncbi:glycosyltransferase family 2 protein [Paraglaciecola sp.]|uniref:glycosyltransferase family 2 protein n=1 Tax=Paraglaciecola sp. TaxID=1920173 RepID=UPI0032676966
MLSPLSRIPFFSVVIPVFNREMPLAKALESLLIQSIQDFEVLIIDDGSIPLVATKIRELIISFKDDRIKLLRHDNNKNGAAARNTGIKAAKGTFLCFLDSDDFWLPNKLELVQACIQNSKNNKAFLIHHQYQNSQEGVLSPPLPLVAKQCSESVAHYSFVTNNVGGIQSSTICVPTDLAKTVGFDETLQGHQDWEFALKVGKLTKDFRFIKESLTIRGKDSRDSVAERLNWKYSLWFYSKKAKYFENESALYFFQRVVLRKAKFSFVILPVFFNQLFLRVLLAKPLVTLRVSFTFLTQVFQQKKRLRAIELYCKINGVKNVIIWGANDYAKSLILSFNKRMKITKIIDSNTTFTNSQLLGINIVPIRAITRNELDNVDAIILATDKHQQSMKDELSTISPTLLDKVIEF